MTGNPNWIKGGPSPNPSGRSSPDKVAARSLALACREAASDEEIAEWLLVIASGRWPDIRPDKRASKTNPDALSELVNSPPDGTQRMAALKEFLLRRDGQPMQAVILKADIEARSRMASAQQGAVALDGIDPLAAAALEVALAGLLAAPAASNAGSNNQPIIDVQSTEVSP